MKKKTYNMCHIHIDEHKHVALINRRVDYDIKGHIRTEHLLMSR